MTLVINAARRLTQVSASTEVNAKADLKASMTLLTGLGFTGLEFSKEEPNFVRFSFDKADMNKLKKMLGAPKPSKSEGRMAFKYGKQGLIVIRGPEKMVLIKNSLRNA